MIYKRIIAALAQAMSVLLFLAACNGGEPTPASQTPARPREEQPTLPAIQIAFSADRTNLQIGECATLQWSVQGGFGVELNGQPVEKNGQQSVCLNETRTYILQVDAGTHIEERRIEIQVTRSDESSPMPPAPSPGLGFDPATLQPFTSGSPYLGQYETGLYPGGTNEMPEAHRQAGERIAATIQALDTSGAPDLINGRILALVWGHSNTMLYFEALQAHLAEHAVELNPHFELVNAAVGGNQLPEISRLDEGVWKNASELLNSGGYSALQVQVLFLHTTYHGCCNGERTPPGPFPDSMQSMQRDLARVLEHAVQVYPNLKIAYLTSDGFRHYTGFEPHVWQEAFAYKWLIESQINGEPGMEYEGPNRRLPWLAWGPYIWDNTWDPSYFTDGVHPAEKALGIFVDKYWQYLSNDSVTRRWLFRSPLQAQATGFSESFENPALPGWERSPTTAPIAPPPTGLPAYQAGAWVRTGGPIGGLGYDIRYNFTDHSIWYVTDAWSGFFIRTDSGRTWKSRNTGITARKGLDGIPVFSATVDPHNPSTIWLGTDLTGDIFKSTDGGHTWVEMTNGIDAKLRPMSFRGFTVDPRSSTSSMPWPRSAALARLERSQRPVGPIRR
jgi:hypothetical protein